MKKEIYRGDGLAFRQQLDNVFVVVMDFEGEECMVGFNGDTLATAEPDNEEMRDAVRTIVAATGDHLRLVRYVRAEDVEEDYGTR